MDVLAAQTVERPVDFVDQNKSTWRHARSIANVSPAAPTRQIKTPVLIVSIIRLMSRSEPDVALVPAMSIPLERALLPLVVRIDQHGPIDVVELADVVGRDYITVSGKVARFDELGLAVHRAVCGAEAIKAGRELVAAIDQRANNWSAN